MGSCSRQRAWSSGLHFLFAIVLPEQVLADLAHIVVDPHQRAKSVFTSAASSGNSIGGRRRNTPKIVPLRSYGRKCPS
jgi:hypothetical protein